MGAPRISGLSEFFRAYPRMALRPEPGASVVLKGIFDFSAARQGMVEITDSFALAIKVPVAFPRDLPRVRETGGRIPNDGKHHVNQNDGTLCLGAPVRVLLNLSRNPTLVGFAENCLVPYLYDMSQTLNGGTPFAFGELAHGAIGEFTDYADLLGLKNPEQAKLAIILLGMKKRAANKCPCPCGCGKTLGRCRFNARLRELRQIASRSWYKSVMKR